MDVQMTGKKLTVLRLAAATYLATYFLVAGGPYGLEELIQADGYGWASIIIVVTPLVFSLPTALMVGELAAAIPDEGGYYAWVKRALGPFGGFVEAWLSLCASFFDMAIYPTLAVTYLAKIFPAASGGVTRIALGVGLVVVCTAYNVRGARSVGNASLLFVAALLGPFLVLCVLAVSGGPLASESVPAGILGGGVLVAMWNFMGWDNASTFAGEVERPQRTYPRALLIAVAAVLVTYLLPVLAAWRTGMAPSKWVTGAWVTVGESVGGVWLGRAIVFGGVVCGVGMYNALLLSYSRVPLVLAEDGFLPAAFAKTNGRGVPVVSVLVCSAFYCVGLLFSFRKLVELDLLFYGGSLILEFVALVVLRVREPELVRPFRVPGGLPGAVMVGVMPAFLFAFGLYEELGEGSHGTSLVAGGLGVIMGAAVWFARKRAR